MYVFSPQHAFCNSTTHSQSCCDEYYCVKFPQILMNSKEQAFPQNLIVIPNAKHTVNVKNLRAKSGKEQAFP